MIFNNIQQRRCLFKLEKSAKVMSRKKIQDCVCQNCEYGSNLQVATAAAATAAFGIMFSLVLF